MATASPPTDPSTDPSTAPAAATDPPTTLTTPSNLPEVPSTTPPPPADAPSTTVEMSTLPAAAPSASAPATDGRSDPDVTSAAAPPSTLQITLLLTSGARHALRVDAAALAAHGLAPTDGDPVGISVYQLKELIWQVWKGEWEARPAAPGSIRLIHFGRMLEDKMALRECRFNAESPNVVHMTVRPQEIVEEEDTKTAKLGARERDAEGRETTRCCVIL